MPRGTARTNNSVRLEAAITQGFASHRTAHAGSIAIVGLHRAMTCAVRLVLIRRRTMNSAVAVPDAVAIALPAMAPGMPNCTAPSHTSGNLTSNSISVRTATHRVRSKVIARGPISTAGSPSNVTALIQRNHSAAGNQAGPSATRTSASGHSKGNPMTGAITKAMA